MSKMKTITRRSMLYKSKVEYMSGEGVYAMNHVLGCSHGCKYPCYAYLTAKRFGQVMYYEDWCEPKLVENTLELLERELLAKRKEPVKRVHMCFATDPFQSHEVTAMSLRAIGLINSRGIPVSTLTKGIHPFVIDVPPWDGWLTSASTGDDGAPARIERSALRPDNEYGISLASLNEAFRERWEPGSAPYWERIDALKSLHDAGCRTWVSMEPFPAMTALGAATCCGADLQERLCNLGATWCDLGAREPLAYFGHDVERFGALVACLRAVGFADRIVFGRWNYNDGMPADVPDVDAWYREAAHLVREFCGACGIECVIKGGTE